ncbi:MAG TPA: hydrogenase/urease maturation nickel metallochaperone HypA [Gemmatimonadaceae bacterium]|nr:hydrogenase/urease maturation nickel metallochaperone HypA [Gemmatimonadaceae bacterium]
MHEMSIAMEVCRMAEERVGTERAGQLVSLGLDVGDQAGVEASNLEFCLETLLSIPPFTGATPVIARCAGDVLRLTYLEVDDDRPRD